MPAQREGAVRRVVVVDTGSSDRTVEIAERHGARVFHFEWCEDFAAARNFALDHTTGEWVLHLDADETASAAAPDALRAELAAQPEAVRFLRVPVRSPWPDGLGSDEHTARRLFRRLPSVRWTRRIHENITDVGGERPEHEGSARTLRVDHEGYRDAVARREGGKVERNVRLLTREDPRQSERRRAALLPRARVRIAGPERAGRCRSASRS